MDPRRVSTRLLGALGRGQRRVAADFVRSFLERDLPQLGISVRSTTLHRFWAMLAHYHGQTWNASEFGRSFGVADTTVRNYLDVLTAALVVRQLLPWHRNIAKRQVRAPKIYVLDSGLLHTLLGLIDREDVERHPKVAHRGRVSCWSRSCAGSGLGPRSVSSGARTRAEIDLLVLLARVVSDLEIKRTSAPQVAPSMRAALSDLTLDSLDVVHAGERTFPLTDRIPAVALSDLLYVWSRYADSRVAQAVPSRSCGTHESLAQPLQPDRLGHGCREHREFS